MIQEEDIMNYKCLCTPNLLLLFCHTVMSSSLRPHRLQIARLLCPPVSPRVCSNWCPLSHWCSLNISSSAAPFSVCFHSFLRQGSFPMSQLFPLGGQNIGASVSATILPIIFRVDIIYNWLVWYPWSPRDSEDSPPASELKKRQTNGQKKRKKKNTSIFGAQPPFGPTPFSTHDYWKKKKQTNVDLTIWSFVGKVMSLLFDTLCIFLIIFLLKSKHILIVWL